MDKCDCSFMLKRGDHFCRNCGIEVPKTDSFLCECGSEVDKEDNFCHSCGVKFDGVEEEEEFLENVKCNTCGSDF